MKKGGTKLTLERVNSIKKVRSELREDTTGNEIEKCGREKKVTIKRHQCYFFKIFYSYF